MSKNTIYSDKRYITVNGIRYMDVNVINNMLRALIDKVKDGRAIVGEDDEDLKHNQKILEESCKFVEGENNVFHLNPSCIKK